jgi:hypothetical protein
MRVTEQSQAINYHQQHLVIIKEIGDRSLEAKVLKNLAELHQKRLQGDGFLITAYQTDAIKEGETIWLK